MFAMNRAGGNKPGHVVVIEMATPTTVSWFASIAPTRRRSAWKYFNPAVGIAPRFGTILVHGGAAGHRRRPDAMRDHAATQAEN